MKETSQNLCGAIIVYLCALLQGIWMLNSGGLSTYFSLSVLFFSSGILALSFFLLKNSNAIRSSILAFSAGGLGMLIGVSFDGGYQSIIHSSNASSMIFSWMTLFMLVICFPLCCYFCRISGSCLAQNIKLHSLTIIPMVLGMALPAWLNFFIDHSSQWMVIEHHVHMLLGMSIGVLTSVAIVHLVSHSRILKKYEV